MDPTLNNGAEGQTTEPINEADADNGQANVEDLNNDNTEDYIGEADTDDQQGESEENKKFSVDDLDFTDDVYKVGGYDLNKYKDVFSEDVLPKLEEYAKQYQEHGFTQEQVEFLIDRELESNQEPTRENIQKELNSKLTIEEKRNYKSVGSQLKGILENNNLGHLYESLMSEPMAYKVVNAIINSKGANIGAKTERETRTNKFITGEKAVDMFNDLLAKGEIQDMKAKAKELYGMLATDEDKKFFNEIVYTNLK